LHSQQPNAATQAAFNEQWTRLLLAYARHRGLFILRIEDAEHTGSAGGGGGGTDAEWDEVLRNPRINRGSSFSRSGMGRLIGMTTTTFGIPTGRLKPTQLADIIGIMVRENLAVYEPPKQTRAVVLYWRLPEEWAEVLHEWVRAPPSDPIFFTLKSPRGSRRFLCLPSLILLCAVAVSRRRKQDN
jgi:ESCRT-II complex subunit VPS25